MRRDYKLYLQDVLSAIRKIEKYVGETSFEEFAKDDKTTDAVVRNLEIIGEATKRMPSEIKGKYSSIEWKKIAGLRDILIHAYFGVDLEIVWDVLKNKLPDLKKKIEEIIR